ncbi:MAG TPA: DoxX family membrane protein [Terracidiphilus sp.]|nr:DoxX family membrane protein [Terracidiphilus sp.]
MIPLYVLLVSFAVLRIVGLLGVSALNQVNLPLRIALALMFFLTASAHWGKGRQDLIPMVPPVFPRPALLVSITGVLEILGAIGLLIPITARPAAICLAVLLIALFPANVRAARHRLTILGRPVPSLVLRTCIQLVFIAALAIVAADSL